MCALLCSLPVQFGTVHLQNLIQLGVAFQAEVAAMVKQLRRKAKSLFSTDSKALQAPSDDMAMAVWRTLESIIYLSLPMSIALPTSACLSWLNDCVALLCPLSGGQCVRRRPAQDVRGGA